MESLDHQRSLIVTLLTDLAESITTEDTVETVVIADRERDHYQLLYVGWEGEQRVFDTAVYIRLHHGKIWIEHNALLSGLGNYLLPQAFRVIGSCLAFNPRNYAPSPILRQPKRHRSTCRSACRDCARVLINYLGANDSQALLIASAS